MGQDKIKIACRDNRQRLSTRRNHVRYACTLPLRVKHSLGIQQCTRTKLTSTEVLSYLLMRLTAGQAPETGSEASLFRAVQDIMENSAQSLRLTRLSGKRDMSTLLSQSAFSVQSCPPNASMIVRDESINLWSMLSMPCHTIELSVAHNMSTLLFQGPCFAQVNAKMSSSILHAVFWPRRLDDALLYNTPHLAKLCVTKRPLPYGIFLWTCSSLPRAYCQL